MSPETKNLFSEKNIRLVFDAGLLLKGIFAFFEIIGGVIVYFVTPQIVLNLTQALTQGELLEDPRDFIANYFLHFAQNFSIGAQFFAVLYLLIHGLVKLWLIIGLWRRQLWYYPAALVVFGFFIIYQIYRYTFTHSVLLIAITVLDAMVVGLTWHEYRYLRRAPDRQI